MTRIVTLTILCLAVLSCANQSTPTAPKTDLAYDLNVLQYTIKAYQDCKTTAYLTNPNVPPNPCQRNYDEMEASLRPVVGPEAGKTARTIALKTSESLYAAVLYLANQQEASN